MRQLVQLREDAERFAAAGAAVVAVGPDKPAAFQRFWAEHELPFVGIPDPTHRIADTWQQEVIWWRLGRMPALCLVDRSGRIRWAHYGESMQDIPSNRELLGLLGQISGG